LKVDLEEFIAFLKAKLKPPIPIDVITKESAFAQFWYEYVLSVSSKIEPLDPNIADTHNAFLYHIPTVAVVPRSDVFVAFVRKEEYDDVYLAYNYAAVSAMNGRHLYLVPYIDDKVVDLLVRNKINPAVLNEALYILPMLAAIPCTKLLREVPFIKEFLTIRMQSYITSDDVAFAVLGYMLLKLLSLSKSGTVSYKYAFEEVKGVLFRALEKRGIYISEQRLFTTFMEFPVDVVVVAIKEQPRASTKATSS